MRVIRYLLLGLIAVALVVVALANRDLVVLRLLPAELAEFLPGTWAIQLPLFLVIMVGVVIGLLIGFVWEWIREYKHRSEAARQKKEAGRLAKEVETLKKGETPKDDVLALLE